MKSYLLHVLDVMETEVTRGEKGQKKTKRFLLDSVA